MVTVTFAIVTLVAYPTNMTTFQKDNPTLWVKLALQRLETEAYEVTQKVCWISPVLLSVRMTRLRVTSCHITFNDLRLGFTVPRWKDQISHTHAHLGLTITCNQQVRTVSYRVETNSWASDLAHCPLSAAERSRCFQQQEVTLPVGVTRAPPAQPPAASSQPEGLAKQARIYSWIFDWQCRSYHEPVFFAWRVAISYGIQCFSLSCSRKRTFRAGEFAFKARGAHLSFDKIQGQGWMHGHTCTILPCYFIVLRVLLCDS